MTLPGDAVALKRYATLGDPEAFEVLAVRYRSMVFAACLRVLRDRADAEDAAQETFLKLARQAGTIRSNVAAWLHACAVGTARDLHRRAGVRKRVERQACVPREAANQLETGDQALWREIEPVVDRALCELRETDRELIVARYLAERSVADLARETGVAEGTISRRLQRALERLRVKLRASGLAIAGATVLGGALGHASSAATPGALASGVAKVGLSGIARRQEAATLGLKAPAARGVVAAGVVCVVTAAVVAPALLGNRAGGVSAAGTVGVTQPANALGPERPKKLIGPFEAVTASDTSFSERGIWIGKSRITINYGRITERDAYGNLVETGAPRRARLEILQVDTSGERAILKTRVESITPIDDTWSRYGVGKRIDIAVSFDKVGRLMLEPLNNAVQIGRNEPRYFAVRPPAGWFEFGRIPEDAGPLGVLGPWTESERIPVTIDSREIRFGAEIWTAARYRIIEWNREEGYSRVLSVNAGGRDPTLIGTRFRLLIRRNKDGYSLAFYDPASGRADKWPSSFEFSPENPVRVISFRDDTPKVQG